MVISTKQIRDLFGNLAIALYLNSQFVRSTLEAFVPRLEGYGLRLIFVISFLLFMVSARKIRFHYRIFIIPIVIIVFYIITQIAFFGESAISLIELINYSLMPFLLTQLEVDFKQVIKYTLLITAPGVFVVDKLFAHYGMDQIITMLIAYSALFSIICAIAYLMYYRKQDEKNLLYIVLCVVQMFYLYQVVKFGSRGVVLSIFSFLLIIHFFKPSARSGQMKGHKFRFAISIVIILFGVTIFSTDLIDFAYKLSLRYNISARFIEKTYLLLQQENVSSGRREIYQIALEGFAKRPLFGNGIDMFFANTGINYPHNLFLQIAYDGGVTLLAAVSIPIIVASIMIMKTKQYNLFAPWVILFSASVPGALFSGDIWKKYVFWYFAAFCVYQASFNKGSKIVENE